MTLGFSRLARVAAVIVVAAVAVWTLNPPSGSGDSSADDGIDNGAGAAADNAVADDDGRPPPVRPGAASSNSGTDAYHVAADGSDTGGDGTIERPWATIVHAVESVPDGSEILVGPGTYVEQVELERRFEWGIVIRSQQPYRARLRYDGIVVACHRCAGITLDGFDVAHLGDREQYVVQVEDAGGDGTGGRRLTFRNNVFHDSRNNDLMKINNGAAGVLVEGNVFYNQRGPDSHIDVNSATDVVVRHNIFFNDLPDPTGTTGSFVVVKDSNGDRDANLGARTITIDGNVFLNWQGDEGNGFISVGEESVPYHHAIDVLIENNLMVGNSTDVMRAALIARAVDGLTFRHNTIVGDLPSLAYGLRIQRTGEQPANERVVIANNIWSDPSGTMGAERLRWSNFSDSPDGHTPGGLLVGNLFWNGGEDLPEDPDDTFGPHRDSRGVVADPGLAAVPVSIPLPRLRDDGSGFLDGSSTIAEAFERLVANHGVRGAAGPAVDSAFVDGDRSEGDSVDSAGFSRDATTSDHDILGRSRNPATADVGAYEITPIADNNGG